MIVFCKEFVRRWLYRRDSDSGPYQPLVSVSVVAGLHAERETQPVRFAPDDLIPHLPQEAIEHLKQHTRHVLRFFRRDDCRTDTGALTGQCRTSRRVIPSVDGP